MLFLVFNRPESTGRVWEAIRQARPPRLYIAADGPRDGQPGEAEKTARVRDIVSRVDWPAQVKPLFRNQNRGCKHGVSEAITWFFDHEERGIILEDDTLPEPRFFRFLDRALWQYRDDPGVGAVCGYNILGETHRPAPFFAAYPHIWGWGTWRRVWSEYQVDLDLPQGELKNVFLRHLGQPAVAGRLAKVGRLLRRGEFNSWDFQIAYVLCRRRMLSLYPPINLVRNIGFGPEATHTSSGHSAPWSPDHPWSGEIEQPELDTDYDQQRFEIELPGRIAAWKNRLAKLIGNRGGIR